MSHHHSLLATSHPQLHQHVLTALQKRLKAHAEKTNELYPQQQQKRKGKESDIEDGIEEMKQSEDITNSHSTYSHHTHNHTHASTSTITTLARSTSLPKLEAELRRHELMQVRKQKRLRDHVKKGKQEVVQNVHDEQESKEKEEETRIPQHQDETQQQQQHYHAWELNPSAAYVFPAFPSSIASSPKHGSNSFSRVMSATSLKSHHPHQIDWLLPSSTLLTTPEFASSRPASASPSYSTSVSATTSNSSFPSAPPVETEYLLGVIDRIDPSLHTLPIILDTWLMRYKSDSLRFDSTSIWIDLKYHELVTLLERIEKPNPFRTWIVADLMSKMVEMLPKKMMMSGDDERSPTAATLTPYTFGRRLFHEILSHIYTHTPAQSYGLQPYASCARQSLVVVHDRYLQRLEGLMRVREYHLHRAKLLESWQPRIDRTIQRWRLVIATIVFGRWKGWVEGRKRRGCRVEEMEEEVVENEDEEDDEDDSEENGGDDTHQRKKTTHRKSTHQPLPHKRKTHKKTALSIALAPQALLLETPSSSTHTFLQRFLTYRSRLLTQTYGAVHFMEWCYLVGTRRLNVTRFQVGELKQSMESTNRSLSKSKNIQHEREAVLRELIQQVWTLQHEIRMLECRITEETETHRVHYGQRSSTLILTQWYRVLFARLCAQHQRTYGEVGMLQWQDLSVLEGVGDGVSEMTTVGSAHAKRSPKLNHRGSFNTVKRTSLSSSASSPTLLQPQKRVSLLQKQSLLTSSPGSTTASLKLSPAPSVPSTPTHGGSRRTSAIVGNRSGGPLSPSSPSASTLPFSNKRKTNAQGINLQLIALTRGPVIRKKWRIAIRAVIDCYVKRGMVMMDLPIVTSPTSTASSLHNNSTPSPSFSPQTSHPYSTNNQLEVLPSPTTGGMISSRSSSSSLTSTHRASPFTSRRAQYNGPNSGNSGGNTSSQLLDRKLSLLLKWMRYHITKWRSSLLGRHRTAYDWTKIHLDCAEGFVKYLVNSTAFSRSNSVASNNNSSNTTFPWQRAFEHTRTITQRQLDADHPHRLVPNILPPAPPLSLTSIQPSARVNEALVEAAEKGVQLSLAGLPYIALTMQEMQMVKVGIAVVMNSEWTGVDGTSSTATSLASSPSTIPDPSLFHAVWLSLFTTLPSMPCDGSESHVLIDDKLTLSREQQYMQLHSILNNDTFSMILSQLQGLSISMLHPLHKQNTKPDETYLLYSSQLENYLSQIRLLRFRLKKKRTAQTLCQKKWEKEKLQQQSTVMKKLGKKMRLLASTAASSSNDERSSSNLAMKTSVTFSVINEESSSRVHHSNNLAPITSHRSINDSRSSSPLPDYPQQQQITLKKPSLLARIETLGTTGSISPASLTRPLSSAPREPIVISPQISSPSTPKPVVSTLGGMGVVHERAMTTSPAAGARSLSPTMGRSVSPTLTTPRSTVTARSPRILPAPVQVSEDQKLHDLAIQTANALNGVLPPLSIDSPSSPIADIKPVETLAAKQARMSLPPGLMPITSAVPSSLIGGGGLLPSSPSNSRTGGPIYNPPANMVQRIDENRFQKHLERASAGTKFSSTVAAATISTSSSSHSKKQPIYEVPFLHSQLVVLVQQEARIEKQASNFLSGGKERMADIMKDLVASSSSSSTTSDLSSIHHHITEVRRCETYITSHLQQLRKWFRSCLGSEEIKSVKGLKKKSSAATGNGNGPVTPSNAAAGGASPAARNMPVTPSSKGMPPSTPSNASSNATSTDHLCITRDHFIRLFQRANLLQSATNNTGSGGSSISPTHASIRDSFTVQSVIQCWNDVSLAWRQEKSGASGYSVQQQIIDDANATATTALPFDACVALLCRLSVLRFRTRAYGLSLVSDRINAILHISFPVQGVPYVSDSSASSSAQRSPAIQVLIAKLNGKGGDCQQQQQQSLPDLSHTRLPTSFDGGESEEVRVRRLCDDVLRTHQKWLIFLFTHYAKEKEFVASAQSSVVSMEPAMSRENYMEFINDTALLNKKFIYLRTINSIWVAQQTQLQAEAMANALAMNGGGGGGGTDTTGSSSAPSGGVTVTTVSGKTGDSMMTYRYFLDSLRVLSVFYQRDPLVPTPLKLERLIAFLLTCSGLERCRALMSQTISAPTIHSVTSNPQLISMGV